jgi:hypothetical protein
MEDPSQMYSIVNYLKTNNDEKIELFKLSSEVIKILKEHNKNE